MPKTNTHTIILDCDSKCEFLCGTLQITVQPVVAPATGDCQLKIIADTIQDTLTPPPTPRPPQPKMHDIPTPVDDALAIRAWEKSYLQPPENDILEEWEDDQEYDIPDDAEAWEE